MENSIKLNTKFILSDYERYLILADNSDGKLSSTFESFHKFKQVMEAMSAIAKSSQETYVYRNIEYTKPFNSDTASYLMNRLMGGKFDERIKDVALQIKVNIYLPSNPVTPRV